MIESLAEKVKNLSSDIHVEEIDGEVRVSGKTYPVRDRLKALGFSMGSRKVKNGITLILSVKRH